MPSCCAPISRRRASASSATATSRKSTKSPAARCASWRSTPASTFRASISISSTRARSTRSESAATGSPSAPSSTAARGPSSSCACRTTRARPKPRPPRRATASRYSPTGSIPGAGGSSRPSSRDVQPPVELRIAELHLATAPIDHVDRRVFQPRQRERKRLALAAEIGPIPVELPRQDYEGPLLLDPHLSAQVLRGRRLQLLVKRAATEDAQRRRRAARTVHAEMQALVIRDRRVGAARIIGAHRRSQTAEFRDIAAQHAVLDVVERVGQAAERSARPLDERSHLTHVAALRQLARITQHERVEDVQPERRLRRNAHTLKVERLEGREALREPALLSGGAERRVIAARAVAVEVALAHRLQRAFEFCLHAANRIRRVREYGRYDYVIAGAGSAGCLLANRLSRDPNTRVLLLQAGGRDNHFWNSIPAGYLY